MRMLKAGEFYGTASNHESAGAVLSLVRHEKEHRLPDHEHSLPFLCLLLDGRYTEVAGDTTIEYEPLTLVYHPAKLAHRDSVFAGSRMFTVELQNRWEPVLAGCGAPSGSLYTHSGAEALWVVLRLYELFRYVVPRRVDGRVAALRADRLVRRPRFVAAAPVRAMANRSARLSRSPLHGANQRRRTGARFRRASRPPVAILPARLQEQRRGLLARPANSTRMQAVARVAAPDLGRRDRARILRPEPFPPYLPKFHGNDSRAVPALRPVATYEGGMEPALRQDHRP